MTTTITITITPTPTPTPALTPTFTIIPTLTELPNFVGNYERLTPGTVVAQKCQKIKAAICRTKGGGNRKGPGGGKAKAGK